jgi:Tfp pilus assembly protein PilF
MQRRSLGRAALGALAVVLLLATGWLVYDRLIAPPPELRQAFEHIARGEQSATQGDMAGALEEFQAATDLAPSELEPHLWIGVLRQSIGDEGGAQAAYDTARALGIDERDLVLERGVLFLQVGNLVAARQDADAVIQLAPDWGYGYYLRASVEEAAGEVEAAIDDYRKAADLARESGEDELEAAAQVQLGLLIQYQQ